MEDWYIDFLKRFETFSPTPYMDAGSLSIGYGSKFMPDGSRVTWNSRITEEEASKLVLKTIKDNMSLINKTFPRFKDMPSQLQASLIDFVYRGNNKAINSSKNFITNVNAVKDYHNISDKEAFDIIKEMGVDTETSAGVKDRKSRRAAMVLGIYKPEYNQTIYTGKSPYMTFVSDFTNPNTMWGQVVRSRNLQQNFVQRLWNSDRDSIKLSNGQFGTHRLAYKENGDKDIIYPEIQQRSVPESGFWFWKRPAHYVNGLVDLTNNPEQAWKTALQMGDTIQVPSGMGQEFTTKYKTYYPNFKNGGVVNYLDYFKNGGKSGIHIKKSHEGSFTKYCNGKVTEECIRRGKNSPSAKIRKQATFAANARTWKHQTGGELIKSNSTFFDKAKNEIIETPINYLSFYSPIHIDYSNYKNIKTPEPINLMDYIIRTQVPAPDMNYIKSVSNNNSSRGYRNNNPLNLRISNDKWMGSVENNTDGSFVQFKNMAYGFRAGLKNIQTRIKKYGNNTIESLITAWAPPSDNNDTTSYIKHVSDRVGINPKAILDPNDKEVMIKLARAIAYFENGSEANISDIEKGWNLLNE